MPAPASPIHRLRNHADYQRVYAGSRKQFARQMSFFFALRSPLGADGRPIRNASPGTPRVGLTVGKVMGKAVDRNRIKRRLREVVRHHLHLLPGEVDVILHPRRSVLDLPAATLESEVRSVFQTIARILRRSSSPTPPTARP